MRLVLAAAIALTGVAAAKPVHPCADDARARAEGLLRLHFESDDLKLALEEGPPKDTDSGEMMNWSIDENVTVKPPIAALAGKGKFDVLEVYGYIYKASYRMHFIYAQIPDTCVLMGQEILEESDPY